MVSSNHCRITRQPPANAKFLLLVVQINDGVTGLRANESAQPNRRPHEVLAATWLVAAGARSERPKAGAVATVGTQSEAVDAHFSQHLAELVDGHNGRVDPRPLAKRVLVHCESVATEIVCRGPRPWNAFSVDIPL